MNFYSRIIFAFSKSPLERHRENSNFIFDKNSLCDRRRNIKIGDTNRASGVMSSLSRGNILIQQERVHYEI
jgi:hypothetical protein